VNEEKKMSFMEDILTAMNAMKDVEKFLAGKGAYLNPKFEVEMGPDVCVKASIYFDLQKLKQCSCQ
jgi:hypothetical protein